MPKLVHPRQKFSGEILTIKRNLMGLTLKDFGDKVGCSSTTVHRWERSKVQPTPKFLLKIANQLKMKPENLLLPYGSN